MGGLEVKMSIAIEPGRFSVAQPLSKCNNGWWVPSDGDEKVIFYVYGSHIVTFHINYPQPTVGQKIDASRQVVSRGHVDITLKIVGGE
jgi:hypothetical protein